MALSNPLSAGPVGSVGPAVRPGPVPPVVLVYRALGLGDLLTTVPTLRGLRCAYPGHRLVVATPEPLHPLLWLIGGIDAALAVGALEPVPWSGPPPQIAVNLHGSGPQSHRALQELRPERLVAYACPEAGFTAGPAWPDHDRDHEVDRWAQLVETTLGIAVDRTDLSVAAPAVGSPAGAAVLHPGASDPLRRWPPDQFGRVASRLAGAGLEVVITGTPDERPLVDAVCRATGREGVRGERTRQESAPESVRGGTVRSAYPTLSELTGLLASAAVVVCNDTGVGHLATATGTPSVLLFGPETPARWGPPSRTIHRVIHRRGVAARDLAVGPDAVAAMALEIAHEPVGS